MSMKMLVALKTDQRLSMSMQLRQAITLLQYSTLELTQIVRQSVEDNPLLEVDEPEYLAKTSEKQQYSAEITRSSSSYQQNENENVLENYAIPISLRAHLMDQTLSAHFDIVQQKIAEAIIDSIEDNGFLTMSLEDIKRSSSEFSEIDINIFKQILQQIQLFDPAGVAACDLRECLLLQLMSFPIKDLVWEVAYEIVEKHLDLIASHNSKKLIAKMGVSSSVFSQAIAIIKALNPHPGRIYSDDQHLNAEPELYVEKQKNEWVVFLKDSLLTNVRVNAYYQNLIKQNRKQGEYNSLKEQLEEAKLLLKGLHRRNSTLLAVGRYIVEMQKDFLEKGNSDMRSMNIADVANALGVHESTVSRITSGKYISTPRGTFELKYFFPSYVLMEEGNQCSAIAVKAKIKQLVGSESQGQVLSDADIANLLKEQGVCIARRTVAKYREALNILPSYLRQRDLELA